MTESRPSRVRVVLAFAAVYVLWGSTYLAIRYAIETLPPFLMAGTRFFIAGAILFGLAGLNGERLSTSLPQWPKAFAIGALLLLCGNGGVTWAEKYIATGLAALLVATEPLWVVVLNWILSRRRPRAAVLLGILVGLAGVGLLVSDGFSRVESSGFSLAASGVVLVAAFAWAAGSVYANHRPIKGSTSMGAGMQMMAGGSLLLLLGVVAGDLPRLRTMNASWLSIGAFFYLLVFGSLVGFTAYSWLLKNVTPARAATYAYVNPVVAVLLGWLLASEPLTSRMMIAAGVIVGSVILITTFGREHTTPAPNSVHDSDCPTPPCA
ncbi:MAG TPA: EamA family transporter [Pyrinomonadaceae bacterium]|nr:EamA family transporter [Pyrinomonadaceae bacterium]